MLQNMDAEQFNIARLYFDRSLRKDLAPIAKELKMSLPAGEA